MYPLGVESDTGYLGLMEVKRFDLHKLDTAVWCDGPRKQICNVSDCQHSPGNSISRNCLRKAYPGRHRHQHLQRKASRVLSCSWPAEYLTGHLDWSDFLLVPSKGRTIRVRRRFGGCLAGWCTLSTGRKSRQCSSCALHSSCVVFLALTNICGSPQPRCTWLMALPKHGLSSPHVGKIIRLSLIHI